MSHANDNPAAEPAAASVRGDCTAEFHRLRDVFAANFAERDERGAALSVYKDGVKVVDLWGGWRDEARTRPWEEDTLCSVYSVAKSMCALSMHILVDRGLVELDAPVATYWPGFARNGKAAIRVREVLSHHCGVIFNDAAKPGDIYDWPAMIRAIEAQEPAWPAGSKGAYNSVSFGYINGEIVRRVDGRPVDAFFRDEVAVPLGLDFHFGVPEADRHRAADMIDNPQNAQYRNAGGPQTNVGRAWNAMPMPRNAGMVNDGHRRHLYPSGGAFTTARSLAKVYAMLAAGGALDGIRILSPQAVERLQRQQWEEQADGMMGLHIRMALGFMKNTPPDLPMGRNPEAFGHYGSNGALAFADPERRLAFAVTTNFVTAGTGVGDRTRALVAALDG